MLFYFAFFRLRCAFFPRVLHQIYVYYAFLIGITVKNVIFVQIYIWFHLAVFCVCLKTVVASHNRIGFQLSPPSHHMSLSLANIPRIAVWDRLPWFSCFVHIMPVVGLICVCWCFLSSWFVPLNSYTFSVFTPAVYKRSSLRIFLVDFKCDCLDLIFCCWPGFYVTSFVL